MALYQQTAHVKQMTHPAFNAEHKPGAKAPQAGIYRCKGCGHEIAIAGDHVLPPQPHPTHSQEMGSIIWQLLVAAEHRKD